MGCRGGYIDAFLIGGTEFLGVDIQYLIRYYDSCNTNVPC